jgi:hypothetical protein
VSARPRLPFGSSLVKAIRQLAQLQTTREMTPRPEHPDQRERDLDRLILAARRVVRLGVVVLLALLSLAACAGYEYSLSHDLTLSDGSVWVSPRYSTRAACEEGRRTLTTSSPVQTLIPGAALPVVGDCRKGIAR